MCVCVCVCVCVCACVRACVHACMLYIMFCILQVCCRFQEVEVHHCSVLGRATRRRLVGEDHRYRFLAMNFCMFCLHVCVYMYVQYILYVCVIRKDTDVHT